MSINPNEDTEFNDALRKHGILPPKTPPPRTPSPPASPTLNDLLDDFGPKDLHEIADDAPDDETQRLIEKIRRQRIAELRRAEQLARFGEVYPIARDDYNREVTEASKIDESGDEKMEGKGTGVVCFLYKDGHAPCTKAFDQLRILAKRYPRTKFVSIIGNKCIPDYPDRHLPTFFIYRKGEIINQYTAWGADRDRKIEELEALFILSGAIIPSDGDWKNGNRDRKNDEEHDSSDDESFKRSAANGRAPKNIRGPSRNKDDEDSDFDL
ncbi:thioredoxin-like protein [Rickenella mellea]|uniref:Thioredoxin-like protein n=1 Tax=Rickenella mellea TaxID=50990 RepID=A0A4Y7QLF0_9AGAM|nr:thioredoxin-like protein [Rickenella mellea]